MKALGKKGLRELGFEIVVDSKITAQQAIMLNRVEEELSSASDVAKVDDIELKELTQNAVERMENLITQLEGEFS